MDCVPLRHLTMSKSWFTMAMWRAVSPSYCPGGSDSDLRSWYGVLTKVLPYSLTRYLAIASVEGVLSSIAMWKTFSPTGPLLYTLHWLGNSRVIICKWSKREEGEYSDEVPGHLQSVQSSILERRRLRTGQVCNAMRLRTVSAWKGVCMLATGSLGHLLLGTAEWDC